MTGFFVPTEKTVKIISQAIIYYLLTTPIANPMPVYITYLAWLVASWHDNKHVTLLCFKTVQ